MVPPSPATGQTGTQIAQSFPLWQAKTSEQRKGIGDNAVVRRFASGNLHDVTVTVRRGNLLVGVGYERWSGPPVKDMEKDAIEVAKAVIADYA